MHKAFLQEHRPGQYNALLLSGKLWTYLADLNEQAADRLACIGWQRQGAEGVTEELKARDQLASVSYTQLTGIASCGVAVKADPFRQDIAGSDKSYPFRYEGNGNQLFVFEAPIDLLSFICLLYTSRCV